MDPAHQPPPRPLLARAGPLLSTLIAAALLAGMSHGLAAGPGPDAAADATPEDVLAALTARSEASELRARDLEDRREERDRARRGIGFAAAATPTLGFEQDLADPDDPGAWDAGFLVEAALTYRHDVVAALDAELHVERAAARLRDQRRGDVEQALLTLGRLRIAERGLRSATAERDALLEGVGDGGMTDPGTALAIGRAELEVDELALDVETLRQTLVDLGVRISGDWRAVSFDLPVVSAARHPQGRILALEVARSEARRLRASTSVLDELELTATYEAAGARARGSVGWDGGRPEAAVALRWRPGDAHGWGVGVSAKLQLDDDTSAALARAERDLRDAEAALASFVNGFDREVDASTRRVDMAWRDVTYAEMALAEALRAWHDTKAPGSRAEQAVRRAEDGLDRAWQGYVRAVADHLELLDAPWPTPGSPARDLEDV
ncbi:MAG: hypothetical protein R6W77_08755 [Trueperaceae bacterium]